MNKLVPTLILSSVFIAACSSTATAGPTSDGVPSTATTEASANVVPSSPAESAAAEDYRDLAVVSAGCLAGTYVEPTVYWPARNWLGAVVSHGYEQGDISESDIGDPALQISFWKSDYITQAFETAATLDPKWESLVNLWDKGSAAVNRRWDRGANALKAIAVAWPYAEKIEARCKVPVADALALANKQSSRFEDWVNAQAQGLLPAPFSGTSGQ